MINQLFICSYILFILSLFGIILNRQNLIITLICIEMLLLASNINFVISSVYLDDILGQVYAFFILALGAAESALGLGILISFYRVRKSMTLHFSLLKH